MSRLVDPTICPDCRSPLSDRGVCTGCGLRLQGPLAARLWQTMQVADDLVTQLRAQSAPTAATPVAPAVPAPVPAAGRTVMPTAASPRPRRRISTVSVPVVLLSLGVLCLLVAGVVFLAVTWSSLGLTGRTLVLVGFTAVLALVAVLLTRTNLRGAAEAFWVIVAGMVVLDVLGAREAGLLGLDALSWRGAALLVGGALLALGVGVGSWAASQPVHRLSAVQAVAVLGTALAATTNGWAAERPAVGSTVALAALLLVAAACSRRLPLIASGALALAVLTWLVLLGVGVQRAAETTPFATWWSELRGWPLLVAALLPGVGTVLPARPRLTGSLDRPAWLRSVLAGMSLVALVVLANAPVGVDADRSALVASATLAAVAVVTWLAPRAWAEAAGCLAAVGVVGMGLALLDATAALVLMSLPDAPAGLGERLIMDSGYPLSAPVPAVMALAAAVAFASLARVAPRTAVPAVLVRRVAGIVACSLAGVALTDLVLALEPPLWVAVVAPVLGLAAAVAVAWRARADAVAATIGTLAAAGLATLALVLAAPSDLALALVLSLLALALGGVFAARDREEGDLSVVLSGGGAVLLAGAALDRWGRVMGADVDARSLALAVLAVVAGVLARPASRRTAGRIALEVAAGLLGLLSVTQSGDPAVNLTVVGTGCCLVAVVFADRNVVGWVGAALLALATVVRVVDGATAPEAYTLPAAALLLGAGLWRLYAEENTGSVTLLGSGLTLALVPSLLLTLEDPVSTRGALVTVGGLAVLALGVWQRLLAPFVLGALVTGVLALRNLEPYSEALPRWVTLAAVGVALLAVGVTWEARLRDLRTARRYLTTLR